MEFCPQCGRPLTALKPENSWEWRGRCPSCHARYLMTYGDAMGGSSDTIYHFGNDAFENEEPL